MLEISRSTVILKIHCHISLQCNHSPAKAEERRQTETLKNYVRSEGCCQEGKCYGDTREIECLCWKDLEALGRELAERKPSRQLHVQS